MQCVKGVFHLVQGDKKSMQQVNYGKTKPSFPKKSYWLPQGMGGNQDFSNKYHFFPSICAQWAMKIFKIQNLKLTSLDNKSKQKPLAWLNHFRITIKSCGQQVFSILRKIYKMSEKTFLKGYKKHENIFLQTKCDTCFQF